jgi:hypothetical protein
VPKNSTSGASSTHGGHANGDFGWGSDNCIDCHSTTNDYVVKEVHANNCDLCHTGLTYTADTNGIGTTALNTNGYDGDATLAEGDAGTFASTCVTCHPQDGDSGGLNFNTWVETHHDASANSYAPNGDCDQCHTDPRPAAGQIAYKQLACRECHVDTTTGVEIMRVGLKGGTIGGASGNKSGNVLSTISGTPHQFPNTSAINNYGACFNCHGNTGVNVASPPRASTLVEPWHASPVQSLGRADLGTVDVVDTNLFGGGGWQVDNESAPNIFPGTEYQGGNPDLEATMWNTAYSPAGKEVLNINWTRLSHTKKAANIGTTKENNANQITHTGWNIPAGLNMGTVFIPHDGDAKHFLVHFDTTPGTLGVDTVSGSATDSFNCNSGDTGPCGGARDIVVSATTSDGTATLSVIFGGEVVYTAPSPGNISNVTIDIQAEAVSRAGDIHTYASGGPGVIFVVSDKGGSTKIISSSTTGQGAN